MVRFKSDTFLRQSRHRAAFTLLDVLVAIAVITILIAILSPTLGQVQEASRRVVCSSNLRQFGLGIQMYADDARGRIPPSAFLSSRGGADEMMMVRLGPDERNLVARDGWDGLGMLYSTHYLKTPGIYYCPSHWGEHPQERYDSAWRMDLGEIVGNYHFRGHDGSGQTKLFMMAGSSALAADGMREADDYNHRKGTNVLRAGGHVAWLDDDTGQLTSMMTMDDGNRPDGSVDDAWELLDQ